MDTVDWHQWTLTKIIHKCFGDLVLFGLCAVSLIHVDCKFFSAMMSPTKSESKVKHQFFTAADLSNQPSGCERILVSCKGLVYDIAPFLLDHPGGPDILLQYAGLDIEVLQRSYTSRYFIMQSNRC
jgi:cytochrome b involved in lipid metabolism